MNIPLGGHEGHEGGAFTDEISALTRKTQEMVSFSLLYEEMARQWSINQEEGLRQNLTTLTS